MDIKRPVASVRIHFGRSGQNLAGQVRFEPLVTSSVVHKKEPGTMPLHQVVMAMRIKP